MIEEKPIPWKELLETLARRRRLTLASLLIGLLVATTQIWLTPPLYRAKSRILLTDQPVSGPREEAMSAEQIQAELAFIKSPALIRTVLESNRILREDGARSQLPTSAGAFSRMKRSVARLFQDAYARLHDVSPPGTGDRTVQSIAARIEAGAIDRSNVVEVAFVSGSPKWSARFVNDLIAHHIDRIASLNEERSSLPVFQQQRDLLERNWRQARAALLAFRERHATSLLLGEEDKVQGVVDTMRSQQVAAETTVLELEAKVSYLESQLEQEPATITAESRVAENETVAQLKGRILDLEMERSEKRPSYTETSKLIRDLDRRIEEARRLLETKAEKTLTEEMTAVNPTFQTLRVELVATQSKLAGARARVDALAAQIFKYSQVLKKVGETATERATLESDEERTRAAFQAFLKIDDDTRLSNALDASGIVNVSVIEPAEVPLSPEPGNARTTVLLGALIGLVAGMGLAFLRDWLDPSIKSIAEATRLTGAPVIGEIPSN